MPPDAQGPRPVWRRLLLFAALASANAFLPNGIERHKFASTLERDAFANSQSNHHKWTNETWEGHYRRRAKERRAKRRRLSDQNSFGFDELDLSTQTCIFNSFLNPDGTQIFCDITDGDDAMTGIEAVCSAWRGSELQLDFTDLTIGHNNMGGVGHGAPYGSDDNADASLACSLCNSAAGSMNQGPCAAGDGQNHGACYWKAAADCRADFEGHEIYDRWWQGTTDSDGAGDGNEESCMRLKQRTGGTWGDPAPTQPRSSASASRGAYLPQYRPDAGDLGTSDRCTTDSNGVSTCEAHAGGRDDCCYPGSMLADVVINIPSSQQVDLWIYPSYQEPNDMFKSTGPFPLPYYPTQFHTVDGGDGTGGHPKDTCTYGSDTAPCDIAPHYVFRTSMNKGNDGMYQMSAQTPKTDSGIDYDPWFNFRNGLDRDGQQGHPGNWRTTDVPRRGSPIVNHLRFAFWLNDNGAYNPVNMNWFTFSFFDLDRDTNSQGYSGRECIMMTGFYSFMLGCNSILSPITNCDVRDAPEQVGDTERWAYDGFGRPCGLTTGDNCATPCAAGRYPAGHPNEYDVFDEDVDDKGTTQCTVRNRAVFCDGREGRGNDNPDNPYNMNALEQASGVNFLIEDAQNFDAAFITLTPAGSGRNFLVAGTSNIVNMCPRSPPPGNPPSPPPLPPPPSPPPPSPPPPSPTPPSPPPPSPPPPSPPLP